MVLSIRFVLLVLALVCFGLAAMNVPVRFNAVAAGLFLVTLAQLFL